MKHKVLSDNEFSIMHILWSADGSLSRPEILNKLSDNDWNPNSIHTVLNNLIKKGFITVTGVVPCGQSYGRTYSAVKSQEEYATELAFSVVPDNAKAECVFGIVSAMVRSTAISEETIDLLKQMLEQRREELRQAECFPQEE